MKIRYGLGIVAVVALGAITAIAYQTAQLDVSSASAQLESATAVTPKNPTNLQLKSVLEDGSMAIKFTWLDNSNNETSFRLYRRFSPRQEWVEIAKIPADTTSYIHTSDAIKIPAYYALRAYDANGLTGKNGSVGPKYSKFSNVQVGYILNAPTNLRKYIVSDVNKALAVRLEWDYPTIVNSRGYYYQIERGSWDGEVYWQILGKGEVKYKKGVNPAVLNTYTDKKVTAGEEYYYRVRILQVDKSEGLPSAASNEKVVKVIRDEKEQ